MDTFINKTATELQWSSFIELCSSYGLSAHGPDGKNQYSFRKNNAELMHQVRKSKKDTLGKTGWFSYAFKALNTFNGHHVSKRGHVRVIETIDVEAPMKITAQPAFKFMLDKVLNSK